MKEQRLSNEEWALALKLFSDVLESSEPERMIADVNDDGVRAALQGLWLQHQEADKCHFLEDEIPMVRELTAPAADMFVPEQVLDERFTVLRLLGRGGMGEVYLAADVLSNEIVALKTLKRELAMEGESRARFREEVQNSRRVTHPNVCRIFDIFEHLGTPFFSMKYLAGPTLAEVLAVGPLSPERGRLLAVQLAEGLSAAHKEDILHCDFKPANVIVQSSGKNERAVITDFGLARALDRTDSIGGGTRPYMAPELLRGEPPTVRSDIYAYGKVLQAILPKHKLVAECLAPDPNRRPESMHAILKELLGGFSRRQMLLGGVLFSGASWCVGHFWPSGPPIPLGSQQRVRVNGFTSNSPETAQMVRNLFIMALRQSSLMSVLGDSESKTMHAGFALPVTDLLSTARRQKAALAIDGNLEKKGDGLQLTIRVYEPADSKPRYTKHIQVDDPRRLVLLAEQAAKDLRLEAFGEAGLHSTYMPLEQVTTASPEALDCYFRAVAYFEKGEADPALLLLDRALAFDPGFLLGHHYRALALIAKEEMEQAMVSEEKAWIKRDYVTERERNWIEWQYFNLTRDFDQSAAAMHKNTVLFPDEAIFQRQHAFALMRLGRFDEAIPYNRTAVELDPFSDNNSRELLVNLAEAGRVEQCLAEAKKLDIEGATPAHVHRALAFAYLQQGRYEASLSAFRQYGHSAMERESVSRMLSLSPLVMMGRFSEAILWIEGDLSGPAPNEHAYTRRNVLGQLHRLQQNAGPAAEQAEYLPAVATNLIHLREGCALAFDLKQPALLERGLASLTTISERRSSAHCQGAVSLTKAMLKDLQGENGADALFTGAKITWPDPINLFYVAQWEGKSGDPQAQLADLSELERLRGKIYKYHFAGLVVLNWLETAKCLRRLSSLSEALRMYERVVVHWGEAHAAETLVSQARRERDELKRSLR
jgi:serine/threonine protein kinase/Tfp pilus assembly protein PilF